MSCMAQSQLALKSNCYGERIMLRDSVGPPSLPASFQAKTIHIPQAADIFVRWGGTGPAVVLIHGYAENSDSWAPLATDLMKDHTVVVPDLRGIGKSSKPESGYDK